MADSHPIKQTITQVVTKVEKAAVVAITDINKGSRRPITGTRQASRG